MAEPGTGFLAGLVTGKSIVTKAEKRRVSKDRDVRKTVPPPWARSPIQVPCTAGEENERRDASLLLSKTRRSGLSLQPARPRPYSDLWRLGV